ncbi:unnamed protein product [Lepeophtheirus salmonis]|uniref:(salmon louse) hypothetical protein n=1 Tax=Lepeophtheirus salmonis TaxID=72036 RepID=A0A7R8CI41_LEPSM|nr:unnamed protein product [Lepeophtheirus salmonis]CAF2791895.1 unnamed protein product [Lepeophtheirus salmonis]
MSDSSSLPYGGLWTLESRDGKPETGKLMTSERGYRLDMFMKSDQSELKPIASVHKEIDGDKLKVTLSCGDVVSKEVYKRKE